MPNKNVYFVHGTQSKFDALEVKDSNTLYWIEDTQRLYNGDKLFGDGLASLTPVDTSIVISGDESAKTIGIRLSVGEGNQLRLSEDGLFVPAPPEVDVPEFAIERQSEAEAGFAATYKLARTLGGVKTYVGDSINFYKDVFFTGGELKIVEQDNVPYEGAKVGDPYLDMILNDEESTHIYIPVKGLVDIYTPGEGITIVNNRISVDNRTVELLQGPNGVARIWNESDGGGVQFQHSDGTWSFVGVNDGGANGITGQIYTVDNTTNLGTRINLTKDGFFYFKDQASALAYTADDEIATKGDVKEAVEQATLVWEEM